MSGARRSIATTDATLKTGALAAPFLLGGRDPGRLCVVGAGIAGLAVATALARRGARVTIYERALALEAIGAGLQISPNGRRVLDALGLGEPLRARATPIDAVELRCGFRGHIVTRLDLSGRGFLAVHRADLVALLAEAARATGVEIKLGHTVTSATAGTRPEIDVTPGGKTTAPVILGADGVRSALRDAVPGGAAARFTGQVAWRALLPLPPDQPNVARVHMLPRRHVVSYPLRAQGVLNLVAIEATRAWTEEGWSTSGDPDALRARFADAGTAVRALLAQVTQSHRWGLFRHPVPEAWSSGGLGLLGDAVHPTLPFLAQGANMALEDAWAIAAALDAAPDPAAALAQVARTRAPRVRRIVAEATRNAWSYHLTWPVRPLAHGVLRAGGARLSRAALNRLNWIYDHDVTA